MKEFKWIYSNFKLKIFIYYYLVTLKFLITLILTHYLILVKINIVLVKRSHVLDFLKLEIYCNKIIFCKRLRNLFKYKIFIITL